MGRGDKEHQTVCLVLVLWQLLWQMLSVCELTVQVPCDNYGVLTSRPRANHQPPVLSTKKPEMGRKGPRLLVRNSPALRAVSAQHCL